MGNRQWAMGNRQWEKGQWAIGNTMAVGRQYKIILQFIRTIMKKKKKSKDKFDTECWLNNIITDPYQVFAELFTSSECFYLRYFIRKLIKFATVPKIYSEKPPADVILYKRMINSTIKAAHALKDKKCSAIVVDKDDLLNTKYYQSHYMFTDNWTDFPRFVTKKEYCNPYLAFRKFFNYKPLNKWIILWRGIVDDALNPDGGGYLEHELTVYVHLAKLIESAHLLDVRETVHIGGYLKNRVEENH